MLPITATRPSKGTSSKSCTTRHDAINRLIDSDPRNTTIPQIATNPIIRVSHKKTPRYFQAGYNSIIGNNSLIIKKCEVRTMEGYGVSPGGTMVKTYSAKQIDPALDQSTSFSIGLSPLCPHGARRAGIVSDCSELSSRPDHPTGMVMPRFCATCSKCST